MILYVDLWILERWGSGRGNGGKNKKVKRGRSPNYFVDDCFGRRGGEPVERASSLLRVLPFNSMSTINTMRNRIMYLSYRKFSSALDSEQRGI